MCNNEINTNPIENNQPEMSNEQFALACAKLLMYNWNYDCVLIKYPTLHDGEKEQYLPSFFSVFPPYMVEHFHAKFHYYAEEKGSQFALIGLLGELSGHYRRDVFNYINEHYIRSSYGI